MMGFIRGLTKIMEFREKWEYKVVRRGEKNMREDREGGMEE